MLSCHRSRGTKLGLARLEDRWMPSQTPVGPLEYPYTFTEIVVGVRSEQPLTTLDRWTRGDADLSANIDVAGSKFILRNDQVAMVEVRLQAGTDPLVAIDQLLAQPDVAWAEPNYIHVGDPRDWTPNDPDYVNQYHHPLMQNNKAWDSETGDPAIVLAILDDGIALNHPDLAPNLWTNAKETPGNGVDDDGNGFIDDFNGWDFASGDNNPNPLGSNTHGTHVAGIAAARTNNATGVAGVAGGGINGDGIRLMPIRWYGSGSWTASIVAQSYAYAADNGAKMANASYAFDNWAPGGVANTTVWNGLEYAYNKGMLLLNSAGNNSQLDPTRGVFDQVLFIGSTTSSDVRSSFSNYGQFVDVSSAGSSVLATTTSTSGTVFTYGNLSGTSMSTPNAAGVAGLIWSANPTWTRDQVAAQLIGTADNINSKNPNNVDQLGTGRTNSYRGVTELLAPPKFGTLTGLPAFGGTIDRMPDSFTLRSPYRFDPATVTADRFDLRGDGPDNLFDTADDVVIPMTVNNGVPYRIGVGQFVMIPSVSAPVDRYRLKISAELSDPMNQKLDGNGNGVGGDDFSHVFFITRQIDGVVYEDRNADGVRDANEPALADRRVYIDQDNDNNFDFTTTDYVATNVPVNILDNATASSTISVAGFTGTVTDVNVSFSATHTYVGDTSAYLIGPTGLKITLFNNVGGAGANFVNTVLDDQAAVSITAGVAPFTGSFRPQSALTSLNGLNPNGTWTLQIVDSVGGDTGTLNGWTLTLMDSEPWTTSDATGQYTFNGLANGTYNLRHEAPTGWNDGPQPTGGGHAITITGPEAQANGRDFGEHRANAIYGRIYDDVNHSGTFSAGEAPLTGWTAYLDGNNNNLIDTLQKTTASTNVPLSLPDLTTTTSTIAVTGSLGPITDVNVKLSIAHNTAAHMDVYLVGPTGTKVELFTDVGGTGDNFTNTTLDDQAATAITAGSAPFSGTYRPEGKLSSFNGLIADGTWSLQIYDDSGAPQGTLTAWSLIITTTETSATSDAAGTYLLENVTAGNHIVRRVLPGGYTVTQPAAGSYAVTMASGDSIARQDFGQTQAPLPPKITNVKIDDGTGQRSLVRSIELTLSAPMPSWPANKADAFDLRRLDDNASVAVQVAEAGNVVTLTFTGGAVNGASLADGRYALTMLANQLSGRLDGNGDGIGGDDYSLASAPAPSTPTNLFRLFGDSNGDGVVTAVDFSAFRIDYGSSPNSIFDFDLDGQVTAADFNEFRLRYGVAV